MLSHYHKRIKTSRLLLVWQQIYMIHITTKREVEYARILYARNYSFGIETFPLNWNINLNFGRLVLCEFWILLAWIHCRSALIPHILTTLACSILWFFLNKFSNLFDLYKTTQDTIFKWWFQLTINGRGNGGEGKLEEDQTNWPVKKRWKKKRKVHWSARFLCDSFHISSIDLWRLLVALLTLIIVWEAFFFVFYFFIIFFPLCGLSFT